MPCSPPAGVQRPPRASPGRGAPLSAGLLPDPAGVQGSGGREGGRKRARLCGQAVSTPAPEPRRRRSSSQPFPPRSPSLRLPAHAPQVLLSPDCEAVLALHPLRGLNQAFVFSKVSGRFPGRAALPPRVALSLDLRAPKLLNPTQVSCTKAIRRGMLGLGEGSCWSLQGRASVQGTVGAAPRPCPCCSGGFGHWFCDSGAPSTGHSAAAESSALGLDDVFMACESLNPKADGV